jgi:ATP-dependent RNA helicase DeaD
MTLVEPTSDSEPQAGGFTALRLGEPILRALDEIGYSEPTPVQAATYPLAVAGRDIIVQARTGTGKTAAFGIPLVDKLVTRDPYVQALVLAPTRELALQSQRELARLGQHKQLHVVAIYGGAPMGRQIEELQGGAQIVSGTPGRVLDHLRRGTLEPSRLRVLVLDEMDEMLSMGFAKELNAILELIPDRAKRQTMCFSATVDGEVRRHAERHMNEPEMVSLSSDAVGVEQITHYAYMVPGSDRAGDLVRILEVEDPESAIIFCNMRSETERVAGSLKAAGFNADWLNGDLPQKDRERIMGETREGKLRYLVATDVAARGIDISHLTHVINYTFPESAAVYVHRTGRTGRAGRTGCAVSLVSPDELGRLYYLRLEYKISPIERSLPTRGELNTRQETDRILLLESAFAGPPVASDLAVARRLLTHPDVERILGGLLHTFLGTHDEVDEEAAAVRRTRRPTPMELPPAARPERAPDHMPGRRTELANRDEGPRDGGRDRGRRRGRDRERGPREHDRGPTRDRPEAGGRDRDRRDRPEHEGSPAPQPQAAEHEPAQDAAGHDQPFEAAGRSRSRRRPSERPQPPRERPPEDGPLFEPAAADASQPADAADGGWEDAGDAGSQAQLSGMLFLNLGKRDGVRVAEVARLLRESCELSRAEVGRIRVRDRYTFVDVPSERLDAIIAALRGVTLHDKPLAPERAKAAKA